MDNFRQDLIEALIIGGAQSHNLLAADLGSHSPAEVLSALKSLKADGLAREMDGQNIGAAECYVADHPQMEPYSSEDYEFGPIGVKWRYCGGPISRALEAAA
jgi:hypothetical protein